LQFLQAHPQAAKQEVFQQSSAPLLEKNPINWEEVRKNIHSSIRQFYEIDLSNFGEAVIKPLLNDVYFIASLKEEDNEKLLGFMLLAKTPALPYGSIKVINLVVDPNEEDRSLDKLLLSGIYKIDPEVQDFFLFARPTDFVSLEKYRSWGFIENKDPRLDPNHKIDLNSQIFMEYKSALSSTLQNEANNLKPLKTSAML